MSIGSQATCFLIHVKASHCNLTYRIDGRCAWKGAVSQLEQLGPPRDAGKPHEPLTYGWLLRSSLPYERIMLTALHYLQAHGRIGILEWCIRQHCCGAPARADAGQLREGVHDAAQVALSKVLLARNRQAHDGLVDELRHARQLYVLLDDARDDWAV
jgi:hypothetical protein